MKGGAKRAGLKTFAMAALIASLTAGCTVGPDYKRPPVVAPDTFRGAEPAAAAGPNGSGIGWPRFWDRLRHT